MGRNRNTLLRECLIKSNLLFDILFYLPFLFVYLLVSLKVNTYWQNDAIEFLRLEELKQPNVRSLEGEEGIEW